MIRSSIDFLLGNQKKMHEFAPKGKYKKIAQFGGK